jgi:hypothetical protein
MSAKTNTGDQQQEEEEMNESTALSIIDGTEGIIKLVAANAVSLSAVEGAALLHREVSAYVFCEGGEEMFGRWLANDHDLRELLYNERLRNLEAKAARENIESNWKPIHDRLDAESPLKPVEERVSL